MAWGSLAAQDAMSAPTTKAEKKFRTLIVDYLVECPASPVHPQPGSIEADLEQGHVPPWLKVLTAKTEALQIYRVQPSAP